MSDYAQDLKRYRNGKGRLEFQEPSFWALTIYRYGQWCQKIKPRPVKFLCKLVYWPFFCVVTLLTGINLPITVKIGPGLRIWHFGCIVLHPQVVIGKNCDIRHEVTIGNRKRYSDVPLLGDNIKIGAGAKIIGKIKIGNDVTIGANAVVLQDVPDNCTAVGIPARIYPQGKQNRNVIA